MVSASRHNDACCHQAREPISSSWYWLRWTLAHCGVSNCAIGTANARCVADNSPTTRSNYLRHTATDCAHVAALLEQPVLVPAKTSTRLLNSHANCEYFGLYECASTAAPKSKGFGSAVANAPSYAPFATATATSFATACSLDAGGSTLPSRLSSSSSMPAIDLAASINWDSLIVCALHAMATLTV